MSLCNICCSNNINILQRITNPIDIEIFQVCVNIFIPDIVFKNDISLYLCAGCCNALNIFNKLRQLCLLNQNVIRQLHSYVKTEHIYEETPPNNFETVYVPEKIITDDKTDLCNNNNNLSTNADDKKKEIKEESKTMLLFVTENTNDKEECSQEEARVKVYTCEYCTEAAYATRALYEKHLKRAHNVNDLPASEDYCRRHECEFCRKRFPTPSLLEMHRRVHTGHKPFECSTCDKKFTQHDHLIVHERIHSGDRPFKCFICGKAFTQHSHLTSHKRVHTGFKPYICTVCDKSFSNQSNLNTHKKKHAGAINCTSCLKSFACTEELIEHIPQHANERSFICDVCNRAFKFRGHLEKHKYMHN